MSSLATLALLIGKSLRQHALSTLVTVLSAALASGLVMAVFNIEAQANRAFAGEVGFDAVLGARGSPLQLVLNSVFHLETSPGNLPWKLYTEIAKDRRVQAAFPYAVGDNYLGYRVVGTTPELITEFEPRPGQKLRLRSGHQNFDPSRAEAVLGASVARETGLKRGFTFQPSHGLVFTEGTEHKKVYTVVGVLEPTNTPMDRVIWIPIEGVFRMDGHVLMGSGDTYVPQSGVEIPEEAKEVSAVMLKLRSPRDGITLAQEINRQGTVATLAFPIATVMGEIFQKLGWMSAVLRAVAYLTVLVAAGSILASLYNTMNERRREFAILRALGAQRRLVFLAIVGEAAAIAALGAAAGFLVYAAILFGTAVLVQGSTGVVLAVDSFHPALVVTPLLVIALGALAGLLPALKAYSTDVAENLLPSS